MSRADDARQRMQAELDVIELEEELAAAKAADEVTAELKLRLREARRTHRDLRSGDAVAAPAAIEVAARIEQAGG